MIFSPIYITFETFEQFDPVFIELLVTNKNFIKRIRKFEEGTVYERMAVKPEDFLTYETLIPCMHEQIKIGEFFIALNNSIENQTVKIQHLKQRKQGLLQKMFI